GAWTMLAAIAREEHGGRPETFLVNRLGQKLFTLSEDWRQQAARSVAEALVAAGDGPALVPLLAATDREALQDALLWQVALGTVARLPAPVEAGSRKAVLPLLGERRVPRPTRLAATAALLETTGKDGPAALELLRAFVAGTGKDAAIKRLRS